MFRSCGFVAVFASFLSFVPHAAHAREEPVGYLDLDELKYVIQVAIREAVRDQDREPYFLITGITLDLQGVETSGAGGGFKIPIFQASASAEAMAEYTGSNTLVVELEPGAPVVTRPVPNIQLSAMIGAVKDAFHGGPAPQDGEGDVAAGTPGEEGGTGAAAEETPGDDGAPEPAWDWGAKTISYTYSGTLRQKAEGGLELFVFNARIENELKNIQKITFHMCRTYNKINCAPE